MTASCDDDILMSVRRSCYFGNICTDTLYRCREKFVAPGKFFPPLYSHDLTNPNPNPNSNSSPNLNPNPYCCMWELFSGVTNFPLHRSDAAIIDCS